MISEIDYLEKILDRLTLEELMSMYDSNKDILIEWKMGWFCWYMANRMMRVILGIQALRGSRTKIIYDDFTNSRKRGEE